MNSPGILKQIGNLSKRYFDYMSRHYPVICSSDEFYFFPRANKSIDFLNILDNLNKQKIIQDIAYINKLKRNLKKLEGNNLDLESLADLMLLNQSMSSFLREFEEFKIWKSDPTLYLRIVLLGIDQLISRFSFIKENTPDLLIDRLSSIPKLLKQAKHNLIRTLPESLMVSLELTEAAIDYLKTLPHFFEKNSNLTRQITKLNNKNIRLLSEFSYFLRKLPLEKSQTRSLRVLNEILKNSYSCHKEVGRIFDIAFNEYQDTLRDLSKIAKMINPAKSWQQILAQYSPHIDGTDALLKLYTDQIKSLKDYLNHEDTITVPKSQDIRVRLTPDFLKPVRASASYVSPLTNDLREPAYFYITANFIKTKDSKEKLITDVHNEYTFVTAHETFPGHHLLDTYRKRMKNPIRQQIEIPLFYEGWASYAEKFIIESGFIKDPIQKMIGLKRQAWRAVRAMLDTGIYINKFNRQKAGVALENLGYHPYIVKQMLRHYMLTCGYQLCYTTGKFEFDRLKKKFAPKFGLKKFHQIILEGGQIPFEIMERRMENLLCKMNS